MKKKLSFVNIIFFVVFGVLTGVLWAYLCPIPLIPGAFYTFVCYPYIANAAIGFNLPWGIAYPVGAVCVVAYVGIICWYGKKRASRLRKV